MRYKTIAAIDLGTNTFNVLIAEPEKGRIGRILYAEEIPVKLGEGGINQGYIAPAAFRRGVETLRRIGSEIDRFRPGVVRAYATSAIRSASNGNEFMETVLRETGIGIETIDGDREAELICLGVRAALSVDRTALIMDIGGGSVEFILYDGQGIRWKKSYPLGAARLREEYHRSEPVSPEDLSGLTRHLQAALADLLEACAERKPEQLIGSAGAFETFDAILRQGMAAAPEPAVEFQKQELMKLLERLIGSTREEREQMPGLAAFRVDMIVMASVLTRFVLERTRIPRVFLSAFSLKEGMVMEMAGEA